MQGRATSAPWTSQEIAALRRLASLGAPAAAEALGRSVGAVKSLAWREGISLRTPGARSGPLVGQRRGESLVDRRRAGAAYQAVVMARDAVVTGVVSPQAVVAFVESRSRGEEVPPPLCPRCAKRPQEADSGWCRPCHFDALAQRHLDEAAAVEAIRHLAAARQQKRRTLLRARSAGSAPP